MFLDHSFSAEILRCAGTSPSRKHPSFSLRGGLSGEGKPEGGRTALRTMPPPPPEGSWQPEIGSLRARAPSEPLPRQTSSGSRGPTTRPASSEPTCVWEPSLGRLLPRRDGSSGRHETSATASTCSLPPAGVPAEGTGTPAGSTAKAATALGWTPAQECTAAASTHEPAHLRQLWSDAAALSEGPAVPSSFLDAVATVVRRAVRECISELRADVATAHSKPLLAGTAGPSPASHQALVSEIHASTSQILEALRAAKLELLAASIESDACTGGRAKPAAGVDFAPVLDELRRQRPASDFTTLLEAMHHVKNSVDTSVLLEEVRSSCKAVDLGPALDAVRQASRRTDEQFAGLEEAIAGIRTSIDFSPVLAAMRTLRAEVDMQPILQAIRALDAGSAVEAKARLPSCDGTAHPAFQQQGRFSGQRTEAQRLKVSIVRAQGLKHVASFCGDEPYAVCEVKHHDGRPQAIRCQTRPGSGLDPTWAETFELHPWREGEALELAIYERGMVPGFDRTKARVLIGSELFYPKGFSGDLPLPGVPNATVTVHITPAGGAPATAQRPYRTSACTPRMNGSIRRADSGNSE